MAPGMLLTVFLVVIFWGLVALALTQLVRDVRRRMMLELIVFLIIGGIAVGMLSFAPSFALWAREVAVGLLLFILLWAYTRWAGHYARDFYGEQGT